MENEVFRYKDLTLNDEAVELISHIQEHADTLLETSIVVNDWIVQKAGDDFTDCESALEGLLLLKNFRELLKSLCDISIIKSEEFGRKVNS
ncbi:MAG: hypothetical protein LBQ60_01230 [Bacteroidales bacterium]|jgi:hypothetical protein|nr:hypothetical protein [Bacteroidales bacterium]